MRRKMTPERFYRIRQVLDQRQPDLTVLADGIHKSQNISAILRTCDAVGINELHWIVPPGEKSGIWKRSAGGSARWVKPRRHPDSASAVAHLQSRGMTIYAAHLSPSAIDYREADYTRPCAIVMGAEKEGVSAEVLAACSAEITIPMYGMVESFNVSVATALLLAEVRQQREQAGLYATGSRLPADEYRRTLFEWCHPRMARFCRERKLDYPPLDADGDIANPSAWYARVRAEEVERSS